MIDILAGTCIPVSPCPGSVRGDRPAGACGLAGEFLGALRQSGQARRQDAQGSHDPADDRLAELGQANASKRRHRLPEGRRRVLFGYFRFSRFVASADNSAFSHTGVIAIENGEPVVYDTTKAGVACQPFGVWILDNVGALGVKRLRPELRGAVPKILAYCKKVFEQQVPFDYELGPDDFEALLRRDDREGVCAAGVALSEPIALGDMERANEFPLSMLGLHYASGWVLDQPISFQDRVYMPGNDHHGLWGSPFLVTIFPATDVAAHSVPDLQASREK